MRAHAKQLIKSGVRSLGYEVVRFAPPTRPDRVLKGESLDGWFSLAECHRLYGLIMTTTGSILEIGHYLGRSTACICQAIADGRQDRIFRSYDLGFLSEEDFVAFYKTVLDEEIEVPSEYEDLVFSNGTTTTEIARSNLRRFGLDAYVQLFSGNFIELDDGHYDVIFCDALHDPREVEHNLPHIIDRSNPGCIWAFHDMHPENVRSVLQCVDAVLVDRSDLLGVFLYLGDRQERAGIDAHKAGFGLAV